MISLEHLVLIALIMIVAYTIKGLLGFGEGLVAVSLMLFFLDIKFILPFILITVLTADFYLIYKFRREINRKIAFLLGIASIVGVLVGTVVLNSLGSDTIKGIFAFFVIVYAIKMFFESGSYKKGKENKVLGSIAGFFGGFIDTVIGAGGAPVAMYLHHIRMHKSVFRATCICTFFFYHVAKVFTYSYIGILTKQTILVGLLMVPMMVFGVWIGMKIHTSVKEKTFKRCVAIALVAIGIALFF